MAAIDRDAARSRSRTPLPVANHIDSVCDRFESAWKSGNRPTISEYLAETPADYAPQLFAELVRLDVEYRALEGELPSLDEYVSIYPQFSDVLAELRNELAVAETVTLPRKAFRTIDRYELRERLGGGGFGTVWKAWDDHLKRFVAVKLPNSRPDGHDQEQAFLREARAAAVLEHDHIVRVLDSGVAGGVPYIVFRLVAGDTLREWKKARTPGPREMAELFVPVARALDYARTRSVVHRDLKPSNILIDAAGRPHVADFGLASRRLETTTIAPESGLAGTPAYMSPEQVLSVEKLDHRTDVYSLGATLYEMLTGSVPFRGDQAAILHQIVNVDPQPPRERNPQIPPELETICLKALTKDRTARYQTAGALADDLQRFLDNVPIEAVPEPRGQKAWRWVRNHRTLAAALGIMLCALLAAAAFAMQPPPVDVEGKRLIALDTEPAGARVVFWRLDDRTGEETNDPKDRFEAPMRSPVKMWLPPGNYLVVAALDAKNGNLVRFHEVYRHIPTKDEILPVAGIHFWEHDDDDLSVVRLPGIRIPDTDISRGMARMNGRDDFLMGKPGDADSPQHLRVVRDFYIDPTEATVADLITAKRESFLLLGGKDFQRPPLDHAVCLPFSFAAVLAEKLGKRLPTETEYEYAATNGGTTRFPWGDEPLAAGQIDADGILPVGQPGFDVLPLDIPVRGLCTNAAEWTMSRPAPYPPLLDAAFQLIGDAAEQRVVRGQFPAKPPSSRRIEDFDPRTRRFAMRYTMKSGLGMRCVRSVQPRLLAQ